MRCISVDAIPWLLNINWKVCERVFTLTFDDFVYFCCYWASWHAITFVFGCIFVVIHNIKLTGDKSYGVFFHCSRFRSHLFFMWLCLFWLIVTNWIKALIYIIWYCCHFFRSLLLRDILSGCILWPIAFIDLLRASIHC